MALHLFTQQTVAFRLFTQQAVPLHLFTQQAVAFVKQQLNSLAGLPKLHIITGKGFNAYADVIDMLVSLYYLSLLPRIC